MPRVRFLSWIFILFEFTCGEKKVSVSEVSLDSSVEDIQWLGPHHTTVLLKTAKGRLYRSNNSGKEWNDITVSLLNEGASSGQQTNPQAELPDPSPDFRVESIIVHPTDKNFAVIVGNKHAHFVTSDATKTFRKLVQSVPIHSWLFHPTRPQWALLSTWSESCSSSSATHSKSPCNHLLYVTKNFGHSFHLVASYVVQFSWGDPSHVTKHNHEEGRIFFTHHNVKQGEQPRYGGWSSKVDFSYTEDNGATVVTPITQGNKFLVSSGFIFVAQLMDLAKQTVSLMVSTDGGSTFTKALLPFELQEKSYTILDSSEGAVMLHVNHGDQSRSGTGNVYISDAKGLRYSLSLPSNIRTSSGETEFDKVLSLDGVFLANFKDDQQDSPEEGEQADLPEETAVQARRSQKSRSKSEDVVKTVITFDKGGVWSYLRAPTVDSLGQKIECPRESCWLHLHGITNFHSYAPFYSLDNAAGIIMGTGNVGTHLRYEQDEVNTYLSRDGGLTWVEAHKGAFIYEFGDHGGLIVMADDIRKTHQVVFSWNEGQSWYDFDLGHFPVEVDNIVIEPNASSVEFLLYGTRGDIGVVYHLDFAALEQPPCRGVFAAESVSSDYELWTPSDGRSSSNSCILGRQITYTRRKQTSECFNGKDFSRPLVKKNCPCSEEDYECEFGFTRKIGSTVCIPDDPSLTASTCLAGHFFQTLAYRKVPGDFCEGGWTPKPVIVPCPPSSRLSSGAWLVLLVVFGMILFLAYLAASNTTSSSSIYKKYIVSFLEPYLSSGAKEGYGNVKYSQLGSKQQHGNYFESDHDAYEEDDAPSLVSFATKGGAEGNSSSVDNRNSSNEQPDFLNDDDGRIDFYDDDFSYPPKSSDSAFGGELAVRAALEHAKDEVPRLAPPKSRGGDSSTTELI